MSREAEPLALALPASREDSFLVSFLAELRERVPTSKDELQQLKRHVARSRGLAGIPSDSEVLGWLPPAVREELVDLLRVKPARTASGVAVVTVMTAPHACPHGVCTYCPGGPRMGTPQSYLGTEPAARRASDHGYDPGAQIVARLRSLQEIGHPTDKVDLIVLGGTFTALDRGYQESFVKGCLDAMHRPDDRDEARLCPRVGGRHVPRARHHARGAGHPVDPRRCPRGGSPRPHGFPEPRRDGPREGRRLEGRRAHDAGPAPIGLRTRLRFLPHVVRRSGLPAGLPQDLPDARPARDGPVRAVEIWPLHTAHDRRGRRPDRPREGDRPAVVSDSTRAARDRRAGNPRWAEEGGHPPPRA